MPVVACPKNHAETAEPTRKVASVERRPHSSMRTAATAYPGSCARVMMSVYSNDYVIADSRSSRIVGIQMKAP